MFALVSRHLNLTFILVFFFLMRWVCELVLAAGHCAGRRVRCTALPGRDSRFAAEAEIAEGTNAPGLKPLRVGRAGGEKVFFPSKPAPTFAEMVQHAVIVNQHQQQFHGEAQQCSSKVRVQGLASTIKHEHISMSEPLKTALRLVRPANVSAFTGSGADADASTGRARGIHFVHSFS